MAEKRKISSFEKEEIQNQKKARIETPIENESMNIVHTLVFTLLVLRSSRVVQSCDGPGGQGRV